MRATPPERAGRKRDAGSLGEHETPRLNRRPEQSRGGGKQGAERSERAKAPKQEIHGELSLDSVHGKPPEPPERLAPHPNPQETEAYVHNPAPVRSSGCPHGRASTRHRHKGPASPWKPTQEATVTCSCIRRWTPRARTTTGFPQGARGARPPQQVPWCLQVGPPARHLGLAMR